jgi:hypothetical protein
MYFAACVAAFAVLAIPPPAVSPAGSRWVAGQTGASSHRIVVKFRDGTAIRPRQDQLISLAHDDLSELQAVLGTYPGLYIERLFTRPEEDLEHERAQAAATTGLPQPDLNLYYRLVLPREADAASLVDALNRLPIVESAYIEPPAAPPPGRPPPP